MVELVDIVDGTDRVVAVADRPEAHLAQLLHRIVAVIAVDHQGQIVVQVRKLDGLYDASVGGHVSSGENYLQAATREAEEELGLRCPLEYIDTVIVNERSGARHRLGLFTCEVGTDWSFAPTDEVDEVFLLTAAELSQRMTRYPESFTNGFLAAFTAWGAFSRKAPRG